MKKITAILITFIGFGTLPVVALADNTPSPASTAPSASTAAPVKHVKKEERHPEIRKAIKKLEEAKHHLQEAQHDYAGHRVKAIQFIDQAQQELNLALQSDKK